jgi:hypothetical protein
VWLGLRLEAWQSSVRKGEEGKREWTSQLGTQPVSQRSTERGQTSSERAPQAPVVGQHRGEKLSQGRGSDVEEDDPTGGEAGMRGRTLCFWFEGVSDLILFGGAGI